LQNNYKLALIIDLEIIFKGNFVLVKRYFS